MDGEAVPASDEPDIAQLLQRAAAIAAGSSARGGDATLRDSFPEAEFQQLTAAGLLTAPLPRRHGGVGIGATQGTALASLALLRTLGRGDLSLGRLYEGHLNALQLIGLFARPEQYTELARETREGQLRWAIWNTDDEDAVVLQPLAAGGYRLAGAKRLASGAGSIERALITTRLPTGARQLCVAPMDIVVTAIDPRAWQPLGMAASASYRVDFSRVEISANALIGAPDDYERQPWLTAGAARFAAVQLGGAEALFEAHRRELVALGRTGHPMQQARAGEMAIALAAGSRWLDGVAACHDRHPGLFDPSQALGAAAVTEIVTIANMARVAIEAICVQTRNLVERSVGLRGMLQPHPIERISRDLTTYLRQPAPDAALAQVGVHALAQELPWP